MGGGGDVKPDQNQGMFQNSPWNRPRDDGWSGGSSQGGSRILCSLLNVYISTVSIGPNIWMPLWCLVVIYKRPSNTSGDLSGFTNSSFNKSPWKHKTGISKGCIQIKKIYVSSWQMIILYASRLNILWWYDLSMMPFGRLKFLIGVWQEWG